MNNLSQHVTASHAPMTETKDVRGNKIVKHVQERVYNKN